MGNLQHLPIFKQATCEHHADGKSLSGKAAGNRDGWLTREITDAGVLPGVPPVILRPVVDRRSGNGRGRRKQNFALRHQRFTLFCELAAKVLRLCVPACRYACRLGQASAKFFTESLRILLKIVSVHSQCLGESHAGLPGSLFDVGKLKIDELGTQLAKRFECSINDVDYVGVAVEEEASNNADYRSVKPGARAIKVLHARVYRRVRIIRIVAGQGSKQQCCVFDAARQRPDMIHCPDQRLYSRRADQTIAWLVADDAAAVRRLANRTSCFRTQCRIRQSRRHGGRGATAGTTGIVVGRPGITDRPEERIDAGIAVSQLMKSRFAKQHYSCVEHARHRRSVVIRNPVFE